MGRDYLTFVDLNKFSGSLEDFYQMVKDESDKDPSDLHLHFSDNFLAVYVLD